MQSRASGVPWVSKHGHFCFNKKTFFIINCDNLFKINLRSLIGFHNEHQNEITLVASVKNFNIPYGVCELNKKNGNLIRMEEKPEKYVLANTGLYICSPKILNSLPNKKKIWNE